MQKDPSKPIETNPFVNNFVINCRNEVEKQTMESGGKLIKVFPVDSADYTNVYTEGLFQLFLELPKASKDLYMYVVCKIGYERETIQLIPETYCKAAGVSLRTYYTALGPLMNVLLVEKQTGKNKHVYWVNPKLLFRGKRTKMYPDRIVVNNNARAVQEAAAWVSDRPQNVEAMFADV